MAASRSSRRCLELLDVLDRLGVLLLGERVDGAELLAPARQPLDPRGEVGLLRLGQRLLGGLGLEAELGGEPPQLRPRLGAGVTGLLRADLARG